MSTPKQKAWQLRNNFLWRVKGIPSSNAFIQVPMTDRERQLWAQITYRVKILINESVESSRQLGFNAKYRDSWGKILDEDERNNIH